MSLSLRPNARPSRFFPRPGWHQRNGLLLPPGALGQQVIVDHPFTLSGNRDVNDRLGWDVDEFGTPNFDWYSPDETDPYVGPTLTGVGSPAPGKATPLTGHQGDITSTQFLFGDHYRNLVTPVDPAETDDMVIVILARLFTSGATAALLATRDATNTTGWQVTHGGNNINFRTDDGTDNVTSSEAWSVGLNLIVCVFDNDGNQTLFVNGLLGDTDSVATIDSMAGGNGIAVNGRTGGAQNEPTDIVRAMVFYGQGIADLADADWNTRLHNSIFGIRNRQNNGDPTFTRASSATKQVGTSWHIVGSRIPRAGSSEGLLVEASHTNNVYNNVNPQVTTGWLVTGAASISVVDDTTDLDAAGLREFGPNVLEVVNTTGATQYVYGGAQTGNVERHTQTVFGRISSGSGTVNVGLRENAGGTFNGVAMTDGYSTRSLDDNRAPTATDCQFALEIPDGVTVRFVMAQCEEQRFATSPIPNVATAATAAREVDILLLGHTPNDTEGSYECGVAPYGWNGARPNSSFRVVDRELAGGKFLRMNSGTNQWDAGDGTSLVSPGGGVINGTRYQVRYRWNAQGISLEIDGIRDSADYDGVLDGDGVIKLSSTSRGGVIFDSFKVFSKGAG